MKLKALKDCQFLSNNNLCIQSMELVGISISDTDRLSTNYSILFLNFGT